MDWDDVRHNLVTQRAELKDSQPAIRFRTGMARWSHPKGIEARRQEEGASAEALAPSCSGERVDYASIQYQMSSSTGAPYPRVSRMPPWMLLWYAR